VKLGDQLRKFVVEKRSHGHLPAGRVRKRTTTKDYKRLQRQSSPAPRRNGLKWNSGKFRNTPADKPWDAGNPRLANLQIGFRVADAWKARVLPIARAPCQAGGHAELVLAKKPDYSSRGTEIGFD
jgi:hypothetical protein